jgi:hypothetical protein
MTRSEEDPIILAIAGKIKLPPRAGLTEADFEAFLAARRAEGQRIDPNYCEVVRLRVEAVDHHGLSTFPATTDWAASKANASCATRPMTLGCGRATCPKTLKTLNARPHDYPPPPPLTEQLGDDDPVLMTGHDDEDDEGLRFRGMARRGGTPDSANENAGPEPRRGLLRRLVLSKCHSLSK